MAKLTNDALDVVVMDALRFDGYVDDCALRRRIQNEFPDLHWPVCTSAWDWGPVERSLMRLRSRGLVTARKDHRDRLVDWQVVKPLDRLADIL
jgi:hypothetical protein